MARKGSKENPLTSADIEAATSAVKNLIRDDEDKAIVIKSASLTDGGGFCNYSYEHTVAQNTTNTVNIKSGVLVHNDLKARFNKLNPHLAVICEEIEKSDIDDIETIADFDDQLHAIGSIEHKASHFSVSAFKISGTGENEGVVLTGEKRLSTGEYVGLVTPKIKWMDNSYSFINELRIALGDVVEEVELYMQGKCAPKLVQTEMAFGDESLVEEAL